MARKAKTKTRMSKAKARELIKTVYGDEPVFNSSNNLTKVEYLYALNWYANNLDRDTNKKYVSEFLSDQGRIDDVQRLANVNSDWLTTTYGGISRLLSRDIKIPATGQEWLDRNLAVVLDKYEETNTKPTVNIQDRMSAKARAIVGEIDEIFDNAVWNFDTEVKDFSAEVYHILEAQQVSGQVAGMVASSLGDHLQELQDIPNDEDLQEAYSNYSKKVINKFIAFFEMAIATCEQFNTNAKRTKVRKPRAKKAVTAEKKLATFKYLKEIRDWQIVSVNPSKILGAAEIWVYGSKYKELKVLRALDRGGIDIKGQTFLNIDETKSETKRIRANVAQKIVTEIAVSGKRKASQVLKEAKGASPTLRFRSSADTLILAVYK